MKYNSTREHLKFPEYGRHVQELVDFLKTIEDREKRQAYAEKIVELMYFVDTKEKNNFDNRAKLWKHLFLIADYDLDVTPLVGEKPSPGDDELQKIAVEYPQKSPKHRHYGNNVLALIEKARSLEDEEKRKAFINVIGSYMKVAYKNWNREHYVSDESIKSDIEEISQGDFKSEDIPSLNFLTSSSNRSYSNATPKDNNSGRRRKKNYSKDSRHSNRRKKRY